MSKFDFNKVAFWHGCSPVNLLHIFRTFFHKNVRGLLLLLLLNQFCLSDYFCLIVCRLCFTVDTLKNQSKRIFDTTVREIHTPDILGEVFLCMNFLKMCQLQKIELAKSWKVFLLTKSSLRMLSVREKCPNAEFFLVRIFLYSD